MPVRLPRASMGHAVLLTFSGNENRPYWSYHHTGTLPRLISFVSHSYEKTGGVGVFFPFWNSTSAVGDGNSLHYSSYFFSHSCALFCAFLHFKRTQLSSFQSFPHSLPKNTGGVGGILPILELPCLLLPPFSLSTFNFRPPHPRPPLPSQQILEVPPLVPEQVQLPRQPLNPALRPPVHGVVQFAAHAIF